MFFFLKRKLANRGRDGLIERLLMGLEIGIAEQILILGQTNGLNYV